MVNGTKVPPRSLIKRQARQAIMHWLRPVMAISGVVLAFQLAGLLYQLNFGGVLSYYIFNTADYTSATGIWMAENGVTAILRVDSAGILFALPLSFRQMMIFGLVNLLLFLVLTPLMMGTLEQFQTILSDKLPPLSALFRWYSDLRLTGKAIGLGLVLGLIKWTTRLAGLLPGFLALLWATNHGGSLAYLMLSWLLMLAGLAAAYWVYTLVLPARYLLALEPDASISGVLSRGSRIFRDRRWDYYLFRLSFVLWYVSMSVSYGFTGLIVLPYAEFSNLLYLRAASASGRPKADTVSAPENQIS